MSQESLLTPPAPAEMLSQDDTAYPIPEYLIDRELECARLIAKTDSLNIISINGWNEGSSFDPRRWNKEWHPEEITAEAQNFAEKFLKNHPSMQGRFDAVESILSGRRHQHRQYGPYFREIPLSDPTISRYIEDHSESDELLALMHNLTQRGAKHPDEGISLHLTPISEHEDGRLLLDDPIHGVFTWKRLEMGAGRHTVELYDQLRFIVAPRFLNQINDRLGIEAGSTIHPEASVERKDFDGLFEYELARELMENSFDDNLTPIAPLLSRQFLKVRSDSLPG